MSNHTEHDCSVCGVDISGKRSDARYCSARCRMRGRRRQQKKTELIAQLVELFCQLPNHAAQYEGTEVYLLEMEANGGNARKWDARELQSLSAGKLKALISRKRQLVTADMLVKGFRNLFR